MSALFLPLLLLAVPQAGPVASGPGDGEGGDRAHGGQLILPRQGEVAGAA